jgi:peptidoglycan/LPS O-acetylase OafA/YrhL
MTVAEQRVERAESVRELAYIGGLDGLRALAVVAVMVYHFSPGVLPAGFLGVDVFFVVSGFLIARLVVGEVSRSGRVSLVRFWARRARRLLPALATVTLAVLVGAWVAFDESDTFFLRDHAIGTLLYGANWVILDTGESYFANVGRPSPFLHMWSLAVEEQFYVVLPLVCFFARRPIARFPVRAAAVALALAVVSTVWMAALVDAGGDPSRAYLGSDSHAMGLLVGVALGILAGAGAPWERIGARLRATPATATLASVASVAALAGIVLTMRRAGDYSYRLYEGGFLVFALACGVVITVVVLLPASPLARLLSVRPLVAIGLRSYSLYLWHWPVRVFVQPREGFEGGRLLLVRLVWSVALAEASFRLVERPFRFGAIARRSGARGSVAFYATAAVASAVLVFTSVAPGEERPRSLAALSELAQDPRAVRVDMFGDSTALVFGVAGAYNSRALHVSVGGDARLGCGLVVADHMSGDRLFPLHPDCFDWRARWEFILRAEPSAAMAVMSGAWDLLDHRTEAGPVRFGTPEWDALVTASVRDALALLTSAGHRVYLFEVPCYGVGDPRDPLPERGDPTRIDAMNAIYERVAGEMPNVEIVRWRDLVCPGGDRVGALNGEDLWESDDVHLTWDGAVEVWKWFLPRVRAAG